jgi:DTW domain-containing protein YfiP
MIDNRVHILILRHPQEKKEDLGTAPLLEANLKKVTLKTGLSWANLAKALGAPAVQSEWGVLYLGGKSELKKKDPSKDELIVMAKGNKPDTRQKELLNNLKGIVVLDGTWSQAKAIWWRNAWMLKLRRLVLLPAKPSLYGKLRKKPRRECLSTLESVAIALECVGDAPEARATLIGAFEEMLADKKRQTGQPSS